MAPEYASSGKLTDRSDVFSFGVVLLEIISGRTSVDASQPVGDESLVEWVLYTYIRAYLQLPHFLHRFYLSEKLIFDVILLFRLGH